MNNSLMITILSNVVSQAPKVNQETVDNVRAIISHLEEANEPVEEAPKIIIEASNEQVDNFAKTGEWKPKEEISRELANQIVEAAKITQDIPNEVYKPRKNKGGRPKKNKNG
jgi:hypothetical protein